MGDETVGGGGGGGGGVYFNVALCTTRDQTLHIKLSVNFERIFSYPFNVTRIEVITGNKRQDGTRTGGREGEAKGGEIEMEIRFYIIKLSPWIISHNFA